MNKIKFALRVLIVFFILLGILVIANVSISYASTESYDIAGINETKYPGVKQKILELMNKHPNWTFKLLYTNLNCKRMHLVNEKYNFKLEVNWNEEKIYLVISLLLILLQKAIKQICLLMK